MLKRPAGGQRLEILEWLKDPGVHFPPQRHGDPVEDGVTAAAVAAKLGVPAPWPTRTWVCSRASAWSVRRGSAGVQFYRPDEVRIAEVARMFEKGW